MRAFKYLCDVFSVSFNFWIYIVLRSERPLLLSKRLRSSPFLLVCQGLDWRDVLDVEVDDGLLCVVSLDWSHLQYWYSTAFLSEF